MDISRSLKVIAIGFVIFLVAEGLTAYTVYGRNYYMIKGVLLAFCGALIIITGAKQKSPSLKGQNPKKDSVIPHMHTGFQNLAIKYLKNIYKII